MVAPLPGPLGRGHVVVGTDCGVGTCFHKNAHNVHRVPVSGMDEWGFPPRVSDINIALILEEQHHDLRLVMDNRRVERSRPTKQLPIDRCPLRNESLGSCRLSIFTGPIKFLVDVQSALQGSVSACGPAASAASYLCLGTRSRRAATLTSPNLSASFSDNRGDAGSVRGLFVPPLPPQILLPLALSRLRELMSSVVGSPSHTC